ncbi:sodium-dependent transporter [Clostridium botulinum]|uniref:Sodium-dependent tryptophan transporter n=1 Tax=Clostridium botulinum TaxID=1491 RepID=A0A9Q1UXC3_CLOBO|nr:sodium-dependent transporter [Clostridium botulinum]AEB76322.1 sodium- and chloride-dependent transporter, putative [Clostridium botulinum BKT015925]KEI02646.1 sodium-dependent tryptophan transporter [Clostridium botulinum C/D str. Sp77]KLU75770.1 sodium-dependent tryptophan transporter [Clostridium botulinum V891]KOA72678.1 sodium-dependent tryptophan transporter [Clostridium botulinum]KOA77299.1 sodium-dependent tryptophan transporter [Clostridium botulinum]
MKNGKTRDSFTGKLGFILSCVGAAIGLGNIWMFPYRLGQNGGGAFLIPYIIFVFLLGVTGMISEFTFGRYVESGPLKGIKLIFKQKSLKGGTILGSLPVISLWGTFIFYSIVVGWILKYFSLSFTNDLKVENISSYFNNFISSYEALFWLLLAMVLTLIVICMGVSKGIEKLNKFIMPLLFLLFIILTIRSVTLPGALAGIKYLFIPRWESLLKIKTWIMALGQAFFTVSLTGCALVVFASYSGKDVNLSSVAIQTAIFDTIAALLAALMIIPATFAFNLDVTSGPALMFITVPTIFKCLPHGHIFSAIFFLSMIFAAISSSVIMLEGPVEAVLSQSKFHRKKVALCIAIVSFLIAIPLCLNINAFTMFSDIITIVLSPIGTLIISIVLYYILGKDIALKEINLGRPTKINTKFVFIAKYVFVVVTLIVIILGIIYGGI